MSTQDGSTTVKGGKLEPEDEIFSGDEIIDIVFKIKLNDRFYRSNKKTQKTQKDIEPIVRKNSND